MALNKIEKILVANRGEIALRIMRTAQRMGIKTVAVYSEADRMAPHVLFADECALLGPPPSDQSYLKMDTILAVAKDLNVDAIHPGYGFLSENAVFAQAVADANMIFIGPSTHAIEVMGSKLAAKEAVKDFDVPQVPGVGEAITDIPEAKKAAEAIGYPILIKASAGGGGKGMRVVQEESEFISQMERAISEAESSFGDGSVFIEKYVGSPRHIEIQVLADNHGNIVHLFERECSIQRRHQKVIEEAPSAVLDADLRARMGQAAIDVARACNYSGAGTVEFLLDENKNFYFLEMNTRLQVEHPVTEMITGVDLVEQQIRVARGEKLPWTQDQLSINGHAIELRVYAEDPMDQFLPSVGTLEIYRRPHGDNVRVDDGFEEGMEVPIYYDPMIAKLICHGATRSEAISNIKKAISEFQIKGLETTLPFGEYVFSHPSFLSGNFDTHFVKDHFKPEDIINNNQDRKKAVMLIALQAYLDHQKVVKTPISNGTNWSKRLTDK